MTVDAGTHEKLPRNAGSLLGGAVALFWVSLLALYLELLLIRWIGTEIRIFAYLQNTILIVCFLGLGLGLFSADREINRARPIMALAILAAILAWSPTHRALSRISELLGGIGGVNIWIGQQAESSIPQLAAGAAAGLFLTLLIMVLIIEMLVPIGRLLGRLLKEHPRPIAAYSINVAGSLFGIWLFVLLSALSKPPLIWFIAVVLLSLPLLRGSTRKRGLLMWSGLLLLAAWFGGRTSGTTLRVVWSPYQKLSISSVSVPRAGQPAADYVVQVNNVGYHTLIDLSSERVTEAVHAFDPDLVGHSAYDLPYLLHPSPESVLIVGSGGGNDVAGALRHGVDQITAVEIDPVIVEFGRRYHPEKPYTSSSVTTIINDARSFFSTSEDRYDVIIFGALDSHTTPSLTNARLDHYVYTVQSFERACQLLAEDGIVVVLFDSKWEFVTDRLAVVLRRVFGERPLVRYVPPSPYAWGAVMLVAGDLTSVRERIEGQTQLGRLMREWERDYPVPIRYLTEPTMDDWPYLYLEGREVPILFVLLAGLLVLLLAYARAELDVPATVLPTRWHRTHWHFFFLGAAFLLLEVQNISKASVTLGNTWTVNAVIISGVLLMVLLANAIAARWPGIDLRWVYGALLASVLGLFFLDIAQFADLPYGWRAVSVGGLTTLPMVFSGIVFVRSFALVDRRDLALGANLIGALFGALLQSASFVLGIKALLLFVAAFYVLAAMSRSSEGAGLTLADGGRSNRAVSNG